MSRIFLHSILALAIFIWSCVPIVSFGHQARAGVPITEICTAAGFEKLVIAKGGDASRDTVQNLSCPYCTSAAASVDITDVPVSFDLPVLTACMMVQSAVDDIAAFSNHVKSGDARAPPSFL